MRHDDQLWWVPIVATLFVHVGLGAGLYAAGKLVKSELAPTAEPRPGELIDFDVQPAVARPAEPSAPKIAPAVLAPTTNETPKVQRRRRTKRSARSRKVTQPTAQPAGTSQGPSNDDAPAPTYRLPSTGTGGSIAILPGRATPPGPIGTGGSGTRRDSRGQPGARGDGPGRVVSVASIKRRATPIGDTDFVNKGRNYPADALRNGTEGKIMVRLVVDERGRVTRRKLLRRLGHGLDELAMSLARKLRFKPAIDANDRAVASIVVWTFTFTLPR